MYAAYTYNIIALNYTICRVVALYLTQYRVVVLCVHISMIIKPTQRALHVRGQYYYYAIFSPPCASFCPRALNEDISGSLIPHIGK